MSVNKNVLKGIHWEFTGTGTIKKSLTSRKKKRDWWEYVSPDPFNCYPPPPPPWVTVSFCLDLDNFAMTPRLWYLSILFNLFYLVLPCGKTMWWLWSRLRTNRFVPSGNTNIIKRKICKRHMIRNHKSPLEERVNMTKKGLFTTHSP